MDEDINNVYGIFAERYMKEQRLRMRTLPGTHTIEKENGYLFECHANSFLCSLEHFDIIQVGNHIGSERTKLNCSQK